MGADQAQQQNRSLADREETTGDVLEQDGDGESCFRGLVSSRQSGAIDDSCLATALPSQGRQERVDDSFRIFASKRLVRFYEMEYSIPYDALPEALSRVRAMVDAKGFTVSFPVEVRSVKGDDIPLSTATGRDSAYIAVHMYKGTEFEPYFRAVEEIMSDYSGRPHWGKLHFQDRNYLDRVYPELASFGELRDQMDPEGTFTNAYLNRVLGRKSGIPD